MILWFHKLPWCLMQHQRESLQKAVPEVRSTGFSLQGLWEWYFHDFFQAGDLSDGNTSGGRVHWSTPAVLLRTPMSFCLGKPLAPTDTSGIYCALLKRPVSSEEQWALWCRAADKVDIQLPAEDHVPESKSELALLTLLELKTHATDLF